MSPGRNTNRSPYGTGWICACSERDERELEPYHLYEKTAREFDVWEHAVSLEDMADVIHTVFYEPSPSMVN